MIQARRQTFIPKGDHLQRQTNQTQFARTCKCIWMPMYFFKLKHFLKGESIWLLVQLISIFILVTHMNTERVKCYRKHSAIYNKRQKHWGCSSIQNNTRQHCLYNRQNILLPVFYCINTSFNKHFNFTNQSINLYYT